MKVLKAFLVLLILLIIYVVAVSWVNLWIPKNNFGVFYLDEQSQSEIFLKKIFSFKDMKFRWQRTIPHKTKLIVLTSNTITQEKDVSFFLPDASHYSGLLHISPENFKSTIQVKLTYRLDSEKLKPYLDAYYTDAMPDTSENILTNLSNQIEHAIFQHTQKNVFNVLKQNTNLTQDNWDSTISSLLTSNIEDATHEFPISIQDILIRAIQTPDISTYMYIAHTNTEILQKTQEQGNDQFAKNSLLLQQYIKFIKDLGEVTRSNPTTLEIIKMLPPSELKESLE